MPSLTGSDDGVAGDDYSDFDAYDYPYFHSAAEAPDTVYDLIVRFARLWREQVQGLDLLVQKIQQRCQSHPLEVQWKDSCGDTALHRLCQGARLPQQGLAWRNSKYFVQLGHAILQSNPTAMVTNATNNWKETPLHQFVNHCGLPSSPILFDDENDPPTTVDEIPLMQFFRQLCRYGAAKQRNYWEAYALHVACDVQTLKESKNCSLVLQSLHTNMVTHLLRMAPEALTATDISFITPIHRSLFGCVPYITSTLIEIWLQHQGPDSNSTTTTTTTTTSGNQTAPNTTVLPLNEYLKRFYNDHPASDATKMQALLDKNINPMDIAAQFGFGWKNTILLCHAQVYKTTTPCPKSQPLLHAMIELDFPKCCIQLAIRLYPQELTKLVHGETALTLALMKEPSSLQHHLLWHTVLTEAAAASLRTKTDTNTTNTTTTTIMNLAAIPNCRDQLPLHVAVMLNNKTNNNKTNNSHVDMKWHAPFGLQEIFLAYPQALSLRDPSSRLYPFCITNDMTSAFEMLRADPSVLHSVQQ